MKTVLTAGYTFLAGTQRIDFDGMSGFDARRLLAVINLTRDNAIVYATGAAGLGFQAVDGAVVTLEYDTSTHANSDRLAVLYDEAVDFATEAGQASLLTAALDLLGAALTQAPASRIFEISANAGADLLTPTRAIRCEVGGTLQVDTVGGGLNQPLRFKDGETRPVQVKRVRSLGAAAGVEGMA